MKFNLAINWITGISGENQLAARMQSTRYFEEFSQIIAKKFTIFFSKFFVHTNEFIKFQKSPDRKC